MRLAALGLARAPAGPALTVAVVAISCALACFAAAYGATLHHGDRDQAAYRVPLDVTVGQSAQFATPLGLAPLGRWRALAGGGRALPVQRTSAAVPRGAARVTLPLLALPASGLAALRGWRADAASAPRAVLARRLGAGAPPVALRGPVVARGARSLRVRAATDGDGLDLTAHLLGADGSSLDVRLGTTGPRTRTLGARSRPRRRAADSSPWRRPRARVSPRPPATRAPRAERARRRVGDAARAGT